MASIAELGSRVKAKHPGAYDDLPDDELGRRVKAKFPGAYDDFTDELSAQPAAEKSRPVGLQKPAAGPAPSPIPGRAYDNSYLAKSDFPPAPGDTQGYGLDSLKEGIRKLLPGVWATFHPGSEESRAETDAYKRFRAGDATALLDTPLGSFMGAPTTRGGAAVTTLRPARIATTPEAERLIASGVRDLTVGQRAPQSVAGIVERASADHPFGVGPERAAAKESFMRVAQDKGVAPGAQPPASSDLQGRLGELFRGYEPAYGAIKDVPVPPEAVASLPSAASMPGRGVDARTAAGVKAEVENALTVLGIKPPAAPHAHGHGAPAPAVPQGLVDQFGREIPPPPPVPPKATAGDLLKVRENIRENIRAARQSQDFDRLRLLEGAEDTVSGALEKALTPEQAAALQATDRQYARLMTAANAAPGGQTEFTPLQYLRQVEKSAGRRNFKKGEAGDLQDLGESAREVFRTDIPMTGVRPGILSALPGAKYWGAPVSRLANTEAGKRFLLEARPQTALVGGDSGEALLRSELGAQSAITPELRRFIEQFGRPRARLPAASADEESPR